MGVTIIFNNQQQCFLFNYSLYLHKLLILMKIMIVFNHKDNFVLFAIIVFMFSLW